MQPDTDELSSYRGVVERVTEVLTQQLLDAGASGVIVPQVASVEEAERMAREKGVEVVYNRCMLAEHMRLLED